MRDCDVLIVGGGPAGSSCAWALTHQGVDVLILDKATFPRNKTCAGWITPACATALDLDLDDYASSRVLQPITGFRTGMIGGPLLFSDFGRPVSYGIRRCELDHYLIERSGARLELGQAASSIRRDGGSWIINEQFKARVLVGAGGHFCPVARAMGSAAKNDAPVVVAQEIEFRLSERQQSECRVEPNVPELYFCPDLAGYGWCFRKGEYLNIGLGRENETSLSAAVRGLCEGLSSQGRIPPDLPSPFHGHAYYLYDRSPRPLAGDGWLLIGDSAGLAYAQSGEGIRPAIESGLLAAQILADHGGVFGPEMAEAYRQRIQARFGRRRRGGSAGGSILSAAAKSFLAPWLLRSRWFTRRYLIESWFLHADVPPLKTQRPALSAV